MEERSKRVLYAACGAAGLSFLIAAWAIFKASQARQAATRAETRVVKLADELEEASALARRRTKGVDTDFTIVREQIDQLKEEIETVRAGRLEVKEYANQKHKDALDMMEERLRAFGRERDEKLKGLSGGMDRSRKELEKQVEDRCDRLKGYIDKRLSAY